MVPALLLLALGGVLLYVGAEAAVRGAAGLAGALGIPAFVLGALLFGVDPETLSAALVAAREGRGALAVGEIFGGVLFLYGAGFGVALLVARRPVPSPDPIMVVAPALPLVAASLAISDRFVSRWEGAALVALFAGYVALVVREGVLVRRRARELDEEAERAPRTRRVLVILTLAGLGVLYAGAVVVVAGAVRLVSATGLAAGFVGAAVLGAIVSLDEVLLSVLPVRREEPGLATGNLFGTLAAFSAGLLGAAALARPVDVDSPASMAFLGVAFLYTVVAAAFLLRGRAGRLLGAAILGSYAAMLVLLASI